MRTYSVIRALIGLVCGATLAQTSVRAQSEEDLRSITRIEVVNISTGSTSGYGTGVALGRDGEILTSRDIVADANDTKLTYAIFNGVRYRAQLSRCHSGSVDACIIKILDASFAGIGVGHFAKLGCRRLNLFEPIQAAGYPIDPSAGLFRVRGEVPTDRTDAGSLYPTTATVVQGMSGGPVFDKSGRVVGIVKLNPGAPINGVERLVFTPLFRFKTLLDDTPYTCDDSYDPNVQVQSDVVKAQPTRTFTICEGEYERRCAPYEYDIFVQCYTLDRKVAEICKDRNSERVSLRPSEGGNRCGYGWYKISC
ncbi:S1 family peptidase [Sinorhizobium meliloti]|uniref:S1 family peptidase n=1 Tax=Rhizobium meliloti TaxID=382 RepID=UPI000FDC0EC1|nr:serine protease [Sinorhizobium meliloti]